MSSIVNMFPESAFENAPHQPGYWVPVYRWSEHALGITKGGTWVATNGHETFPIADWAPICWSLAEQPRMSLVMRLGATAQRFSVPVKRFVDSFPWSSVIVSGLDSRQDRYVSTAAQWVDSSTADAAVADALARAAIYKRLTQRVRGTCKARHQDISREVADQLTRKLVDWTDFRVGFLGAHQPATGGRADLVGEHDGTLFAVAYHFGVRVSQVELESVPFVVNSLGQEAGQEVHLCVVLLTQEGSQHRSLLARSGISLFTNGIDVSSTVSSLKRWMKHRA